MALWSPAAAASSLIQQLQIADNIAPRCVGYNIIVCIMGVDNNEKEDQAPTGHLS